MSKKNGGHAFARPYSVSTRGESDTVYYGQEGMSMRQYYAATAMHALVTRVGGPIRKLARTAFEIADAMIAIDEEA